MRYDYFGNTTLRVKHLLYNFETQLIIFDELFAQASSEDTWENNSDLQMNYLNLLKQYNLIRSKNKISDTGAKDARAKSAPLEDLNLIRRKEKKITPEGYELLSLIKNKAYNTLNNFLQLDLISLFFLKAMLNFSKPKNLFQDYLEVFRIFNGVLTLEEFKLLPLIKNFNTPRDFASSLKSNTVLSNILNYDKENLEKFLSDLHNQSLKIDYFKTGKGSETALSVLAVLEEVFLPFRNSQDINLLKDFLSTKYDEKFSRFKEIYLKYIINTSKKDEKLRDLGKFIIEGSLEEFGKRFYSAIFNTRQSLNLKDYADLNRRYLNLTGIFEFQSDKIELNPIFKMVLKYDRYSEVLQEISKNKISQNSLDKYFKNDYFIKYFEKYNIKDIKNYKYKRDLERFSNLIKTRFNREKIIEILKLFKDRKNDKKISADVTNEATIPTIFEYIIALAWCCIDDNLDRIFEAGLSLDSNLLPKSHAVGGNADFVYNYKDHLAMIEATLTEKTNQRRSEMESVSRHLGNLLLESEPQIKEKSYGIFIAPYLDKNVLNDFRGRIYCYFENNLGYIKGMKILPLDIEDLIVILETKATYNTLLSVFCKALESDDDWGSRWYQDEVKKLLRESIQ